MARHRRKASVEIMKKPITPPNRLGPKILQYDHSNPVEILGSGALPSKVLDLLFLDPLRGFNPTGHYPYHFPNPKGQS